MFGTPREKRVEEHEPESLARAYDEQESEPFLDLSGLRSVPRMVYQSQRLLDRLEENAVDPNSMLMLFQMRNLLGRINFESELLLALTGEPVQSQGIYAEAASSVARRAAEASARFENIHIEILSDGYLRPGAAGSIANLLTLGLNRALESEQFTAAHLKVSNQGGSVVFEIRDSVRSFDRDALYAMEANIANNGRAASDNRLEQTIWAIGVLRTLLPVDVDYRFGGPGGHTVLTVKVRLEAMDEEGNARPVGVAQETPVSLGLDTRPTQYGTPELQPTHEVQRAAPFTADELTRQPSYANVENRIPMGSAPVVERKVERDPMPPLFKAALEAAQRRSLEEAQREARHRARAVPPPKAPSYLPRDLGSVRSSERVR